MDVKLDRREILTMMREHFSSLPDTISSDELHGFLNEKTGLAILLDEANGSAFDKWRQALAAQDIPVWGVTPERAAAAVTRGVELKALEAARVAALPSLLKELAGEAPGTPLVSP